MPKGVGARLFVVGYTSASMSVSVVACALFFAVLHNFKNDGMDTERKNQHISIAFINDKSPVIDVISKDLLTFGFEILFKSENIVDGIAQLSSLKSLLQVCIIDLDFYDKNVLAQIHDLKNQFPTLKLIAHSDIDSEKVGKVLLDIGFSSYLLIGSDVDDFRKAIETVSNGKKYFSVGVAKIAQEYFDNN